MRSGSPRVAQSSLGVWPGTPRRSSAEGEVVAVARGAAPVLPAVDVHAGITRARGEDDADLRVGARCGEAVGLRPAVALHAHVDRVAAIARLDPASEDIGLASRESGNRLVHTRVGVPRLHGVGAGVRVVADHAGTAGVDPRTQAACLESGIAHQIEEEVVAVARGAAPILPAVDVRAGVARTHGEGDADLRVGARCGEAVGLRPAVALHAHVDRVAAVARLDPASEDIGLASRESGNRLVHTRVGVPRLHGVGTGVRVVADHAGTAGVDPRTQAACLESGIAHQADGTRTA